MNSPMHVVVVGALVRNPAGEILLIRHPKRGWEIPQGRVEQGEGLIDALHREILEEAGVEINLGPLASVYSKVSPPTAVIFNFLADNHSGALQTSAESLEVEWFSEAEALQAVSHPVNIDRLQTLLSFSGTPLFRAYTSPPFAVLPDSSR